MSDTWVTGAAVVAIVVVVLMWILMQTKILCLSAEMALILGMTLVPAAALFLQLWQVLRYKSIYLRIAVWVLILFCLYLVLGANLKKDTENRPGTVLKNAKNWTEATMFVQLLYTIIIAIPIIWAVKLAVQGLIAWLPLWPASLYYTSIAVVLMLVFWPITLVYMLGFTFSLANTVFKWSGILLILGLLYMLLVLSGINAVVKARKAGVITKGQCIGLSILQLILFLGFFGLLYIQKREKREKQALQKAG